MTLSSPAIAGALANNTPEVYLVLLTLDHASLGSPIRLVANTQDIVSRSNTYLASHFKVVLPRNDGETIPSAELQVDNVDRAILSSVRGLSGPISATIEVVLASSPDTPEIQVTDLVIRGLRYNVSLITATLTSDFPLADGYPAVTFDQGRNPNLFKT